jgi:hypothetical protein
MRIDICETTQKLKWIPLFGISCFKVVTAMKKLFLDSMTNLKELLFSFEFKLRSRTAPQHFSREGGKLGFRNTVLNLMNFNNKTQQIELDNFSELMGQEVDSSKQALSEFTYKRKTYKVRVIKSVTPNDNEMILFTNVAELSEKDFEQLYKLRWPVETKYDVIKNKLMLENFTGKTVTSVLQDFWATMTLTNLVAFAKLEADEQIETADRGKNLKYEYQANTNILIGKLKDKLILMLLCDDPAEQSRMFDKIMARIVKSKVPKIRDKSNPRKNPRQKKKFNQCTKSAL